MKRLPGQHRRVADCHKTVPRQQMQCETLVMGNYLDCSLASDLWGLRQNMQNVVFGSVFAEPSVKLVSNGGL